MKRYLLVTLLVIILAAVVFIAIRAYSKIPDNEYDFHGARMPFRASLKEAQNISIYPDNETIYDIFWNIGVENVTIAFVNSSDTSMVAVEAFEITHKMKFAYMLYELDVGFDAKKLESYENITATQNNPVIVLVPPSFSNETIVKADDRVVYIKAKDLKDFDLATVKFLMTVLAINN
jgi:hypothetical protein